MIYDASESHLPLLARFSSLFCDSGIGRKASMGSYFIYNHTLAGCYGCALCSCSHRLSVGRGAI